MKLRMEKLLVGSARHLELEGGLRDLEYLMLNLPYRCNYKCSKCCNASREESPKSPLSLEEISELITEAKDLGMRVLVIAGEGEPFLDENIQSIISRANTNGLIPYIFTNGSKLNADTTQFIKENGASLVINIDSLNARVYEELTGIKGSFERLYGNIVGVREQFKDTHSQIGQYGLRRIAINTVVSQRNKGELSEIKDFCGEDFVFVCNTPMDIGRAQGNPTFSGQFDTPKTIPLGTTSNGLWCAYMRNGISVGANGEILTCAYSLESAGRLGNVRERNLKDFGRRSNKSVDAFYIEQGHSRCILRHPDYRKFIEDLKK